MTEASQSLKPAAIPPVFVCGRYQLPLLPARPLVMGIVNVTPDSFSDGGAFFAQGSQEAQHELAIAHARELIAQGSDILDIGGESTRPGAQPVTVEEELNRVMPVIQAALHMDVPVSIDTRRPQVMRAAVDAGVDIINDINGFRDPESFAIAAASRCGLCIMHMLGEPQTMQQDPRYGDVVAEVLLALTQMRDRFVAQGVNAHRILIDPGFGFGKTLEHNLLLMRSLDRFAETQPVLAGVSRKSMIGAITGQAKPADRVAGSVAAALWAAKHGASVLRVHDVRATVDALKVLAALE